MSAATDLRAAAAKRILIKDGAFGTLIQGARLAEADYRGESRPRSRTRSGNNDLLCLTRPDLIEEIVRAASPRPGPTSSPPTASTPIASARPIMAPRNWSAK